MERLTRYNEKQKQYTRLASRLAVDNKLGKIEDLEEKLGFKLTDIKEVCENSLVLTASKEIRFNGDDFYGYYTPEELKQVIKNILGEYLRCMREEK